MTDSIAAAYDIPLTAAELAAIGQICAVQGQIEYLMHQIVQHLLGTKHSTTLAIMTASNSLPAASNIWISTIRDKCTQAEAIKIAEEAFARLGKLVEGRNDFVHAFYAQGSAAGGFALTSGGGNSPRFLELLASLKTIVAVRTKSRKTRPVGDIVGVRDESARISCALAHILYLLTGPPELQQLGVSPWRDKFW